MVYSGGTGANQGLKANRDLIGKKAKPKFSYASKNDAIKTFPKKATKEQLDNITETIRLQKKRENLRIFLSLIGAIILIVVLSQLIDFRYF